jgi:hypothetical protein
VNGKGGGRKWPWPNLRHYACIHLEGLTETIQTLVRITFWVASASETYKAKQQNAFLPTFDDACLAYCSILRMEAVYSSKTSANFYQITLSHP